MKLGISDKGLNRIAQEYDSGKTLMDLAELVREKEHELAYGSETSILSSFVHDFDYVDAILSGDSDLDSNMDVTDAYAGYVEAYREFEQNNNKAGDADFPNMLYSIPGEWGWWPDLETQESIGPIVEELNKDMEWDVDIRDCDDYGLEKVVGDMAVYRGFKGKNNFIVVDEDFDGNYKLEVQTSSLEEALERIEEGSV